MALLSLFGATLSYSDHPLFDSIELHIEPQERLCLVGQNGAGKSTLLKVMSGEQPLDDGRVVYADNLVISRLPQDPPRDTEGTIYDYVALGAHELSGVLQEYHQLLQEIALETTNAHLERLAILQSELEQRQGWQLENQIQQTLQQMKLDGTQQLSTLSGGWLRKVALAQALVCQPNILLLDEPTNHLDVDSIQEMEQFLKDFMGSIVFISHDRSFIRSIATRIIDLDRGKLSSWPGSYELYLTAKEEQLRVEALQHAEFDRKLAREEIWIRQGIKARRTRNEGRVRALKALRTQYAERRVLQGKVQMQIDQGTRSGKIIFDVANLSYSLENKLLINNLTTQILRGDKIALLGPNGCGKTTLLKLLLQQLSPTEGEVAIGTKLDIAYFDQYRSELDPNKTVMDNLTNGKQEVTVNGRTRHALGYLQDFLFSPKRALTPIKALSGGEKNRLLLAKLFLKPSNLLILDEPTNDLDIETLELLEELLSDYQGTLLIVSHDRQFIDNVVTSCWMFSPKGEIQIYPGGYYDARAQYERYNDAVLQLEQHNPKRDKKEKVDSISQNDNNLSQRNSKQSSVKIAKELKELPLKIEQIELKLAQLQQQINSHDFFQQPLSVTQPILQELAKQEALLEEHFSRWEQLER